MQLTLHTDYSLRVLLYLAARNDRLITISELSQAYGISRNHLVKVVHRLAQYGWIETFRGKGGGMRLAFPPEQINIGAIVRQMEPHMHLLECFDASANTCSISPVCTLKRVMYHARKSFMDVLDQYTLADALGPQPNSIIEILEQRADKPATEAAA